MRFFWRQHAFLTAPAAAMGFRLYQSKLSGPIADRIDLQVRVEREEDTEDFGDGGLIYSSNRKGNWFTGNAGSGCCCT